MTLKAIFVLRQTKNIHHRIPWMEALSKHIHRIVANWDCCTVSSAKQIFGVCACEVDLLDFYSIWTLLDLYHVRWTSSMCDNIVHTAHDCYVVRASWSRRQWWTYHVMTSNLHITGNYMLFWYEKNSRCLHLINWFS